MRQIHLYLALAIGWMLPAIISCSTKAQDSVTVEALRKAAKTEIAEEDTRKPQDSTFTSGALGLQRLNPEISVTGDFLCSYRDTESDDAEFDFLMRCLGLHFEAYLDPFTKFKAAVGVHEDGAELGEAYMTRFGILPQVNLTLGKFRQQFGVVNRWHKHGLDQVDFPLALRMIFGEGGLNQVGGSIDWTIPSVAECSQELTVQVTDGQNDRVFGENANNIPCVLGHYKVFRDITDSTYVQLGASGLYGRNDEWQVLDVTEDQSLDTFVAGVDFTALWEPTDRMRYRNITWRSEAYALNKGILAPDGSGKDTLNAWGAYSYVESKVSRTFILGVRGDYFVPDVKQYAEYTDPDGSITSLSPLAVTEDDSYRWQVGPYITWHQSPFVHFRAEYNHSAGHGTGPEENVVWLQCIFAAGPHKHERY